MNIENLQYFISLAETLNFTKAAKNCHIAQTAMSRYIAQLEKSLGVTLFERDKRKVVITKAGLQFYQDAVKLQEQYRRMLFRAIQAGGLEKSHIKIGFGLYEFSSLSTALSELSRAYPGILMEIHQYSYSILVEKLMSGELDMIVALDVCRNFLPMEGMEETRLFSGRNMLVMNRQKAALYRDTAVGDVLDRETVITNCEDNGPSSVAMMQDTLRQDFGAKAPSLLQTNSYEAQILMIQAGQGVAFIPEFLEGQLPGDLTAWELVGSTVFDYYEIHCRERLSEAVSLICGMLKKS